MRRCVTSRGRACPCCFLSTELAELCGACDRVAVFREQGVVAMLDRAALSEARLIAAVFGQAGAEPVS